MEQLGLFLSSVVCRRDIDPAVIGSRDIDLIEWHIDKKRGHYIYPELYSQLADREISSLHFP